MHACFDRESRYESRSRYVFEVTSACPYGPMRRLNTSGGPRPREGKSGRSKGETFEDSR
jgi:hypothetical protein